MSMNFSAVLPALVENNGVEPLTSCVQGRRSSQLSYETLFILISKAEGLTIESTRLLTLDFTTFDFNIIWTNSKSNKFFKYVSDFSFRLFPQRAYK